MRTLITPPPARPYSALKLLTRTWNSSTASRFVPCSRNPEISLVFGADRFRTEVDLAARLSHPHILGLLDSGDADGYLYYVMPYVGGETLRSRIGEER